MDKKTLIKRLIEGNDGKIFISKNRIRKVVGIGDMTVNEMLEGHDYTVTGRNHAHMYLVDDVADAIMRR